MEEYTKLAFQLDPEEEVSCYICSMCNDFTTYRKGQAYLAGPEHYPFDGNANFICKEHLEEDFEIYPPDTE